ncbi:AMP-binding protein [Patulibacter sp. NPDC049589]|uniref:AMP-dependent synthetase/ligase n=1 Tax=Patulibacter sp. NPDC049589 TaxID=3154731 RepID=UPI0034320A4A
MPQTTHPAQDDAIAAALRQPTIPAAFRTTVEAKGDAPALRDHGSDLVITWREYGERVDRVAAGLAALGIGAGDTVGLMMGNRHEFHLVDLATMHLGAVPFSIYQTNPAPQILPMIEIAEPRVIVAETQYLPVVREVVAQTASIERIVLVDGSGEEGTITLAELEALGAADFDVEAAWSAIDPTDTAMIVYTSGTTGRPKGVEWSHGALMENLRGLQALAPVSPGGRVVSALPMAHLLERFLGHLSAIAFGFELVALADAKQLGAALAGTRPTRFYGVPRIFEKLAGGAAAVAGSSPELQAAYEANLQRVRTEGAHAVENDPAAIEAIRPIRQKLGVDDAEWRGSAGAPARVDILEAFAALGLPIAEIWGMSETALSLMNPPTAVRIGTVGKPQPGFEAKAAEDGELLLRGPIFTGYRNQPELTAESVVDGWMHTGDVIETDADGYIKIVDRKKELLINSAGKNIPPVMVENRVKQQSPVVGQVVALCDQQPYLTALVVVDEEGVAAFAAANGLEGTPAEVAASPEVAAEIDRAVAAANETLARVEQIKKHTLVPGFWTPGGDEVTMTMKLRRKNIAKAYADEIAALYA